MFGPVNGELSRREVVYLAIRDRRSDELIPYSDLPYEREIVAYLRESVSKLLERDQRRYVECVPGEGWRIVSGSRQVEIATRRRRQATRRMGRALQIISAVDRSEMSAQERLRADAELIATSTGYRVLRGIASKSLGVEDVKAWQKHNGLGGEAQ